MLIVNGKIADVRGMPFGKLRAVEPTSVRKNNAVVWRCSCECGGTVCAPLNYLRQGRKTHCGCQPHGNRRTNEQIVVELEETDAAAYAIASQADKIRQLGAALRRSRQMPA